jgi:hypothetical protein
MEVHTHLPAKHIKTLVALEILDGNKCVGRWMSSSEDSALGPGIGFQRADFMFLGFFKFSQTAANLRTRISQKLSCSKSTLTQVSRPSRFEKLSYLWRSPTPPEEFVPPPAREVFAAKLIGAVCFFWIFYKLRNEGAIYLVNQRRMYSSPHHTF